MAGHILDRDQRGRDGTLFRVTLFRHAFLVTLFSVEMCELSELCELSRRDAMESLSVKGAMGGSLF
jgi:hypothetical protein